MDAVLLNSGGLDTLATAKILHQAGHTLHSLYVDVGQVNRIPTLASAKKIADLYCESHHVYNFPEVFIVPIEKLKSPGVAFQSCFVFVCGAIYAKTIGVDFVASGLKGDAATDNFDSCYLNFLNTSKLTSTPAPIRPLFKGEGSPLPTMEYLMEVIGDIESVKQTYSCNSYPPCGVCAKCLKRQEMGI